MLKSLKKGLVIGLSAFMVAASAVPMALATKVDTTTDEAVELPESIYDAQSGTIVEVKDFEGRISLLVEKSEDDSVLMHVAPEITYISSLSEGEPVDADYLEAGQKITAFAHMATPVTASLPAQYTPEVIVVEDDNEAASSFKVDVFDVIGEGTALVSSDNTLALNMSEETEISDYSGAVRSAEHAKGQALLVFYGASTRSIPAQTVPEQVIILKGRAKINAEQYIKGLDGQYIHVTDEVARVQIRHVAEELGYTVEWIADTQTVVLNKGAVSFTVTIGALDYGYNRSLRQFENAPLLVDGKTCVDLSFIEELMSI